MRIITDIGQYDLPANFVLELERKNPFFSKIGEKSIPVTLPITPNNLKIIGYNKLDSKNKPVTSLDVLIEDGVTRLFAKQVIHKTSKEGISTTFYPNIGAFWTKIKDKKLKDVMTQYSYTSSSLMTDLQNSMKSTSTYDFVVFPVACNNGSDDYFILNQTENVDSGGTPYLIGRKSRTIKEGDKDTVVPINYGITPFLRLHSALSMVVSHFGYTINNNFLSGSAFKNLCILNNSADTVVINRIEYSQIVPNISIQDLLDVIRTTFGCEFIPDEANKTISISFFKDQLSHIPSIDLSGVKAGEFDYDLPSFSQLVINQDASLENAAPETDTLEKFIDKYKSVGAVNEDEWADQAIVSRYSAVLRLAEGRFYAIEFDGINTRREPVSSSFFNYNKGGDLTSLEIQLKNTAVPVVQVGSTLMPFVGNILHVNTAIKEKSGETKEEKKDSSKFAMLCFAKFGTIGNLLNSYGSPFNYDNKGVRDGDYSLQTWGLDGIFHRFYKQMDSFYRHSNMIVSVDILLTEAQKNNVSEIQPLLIKNQLLLPDTIAFTIGRRLQKKCLFRTVKFYEPYNLPEEQSIPSLITDHTSSIFFWEYNDDSAVVVPPTHGLYEYIFRLNGEIVQPVASPTAQQYADSQDGVKFFENSVSIIVEHYVMSNFYDEVERTLTYWYTVAAK